MAERETGQVRKITGYPRRVSQPVRPRTVFWSSSYSVAGKRASVHRHDPRYLGSVKVANSVLPGDNAIAAAVDAPPAEVNVCVVGAGHGAHALMAYLPARGFVTRVLATSRHGADAADAAARRIGEGIRETGGVTCTFASHLEPRGDVTGAPVKVSSDAHDVIPQSNVVMLMVPSFAYTDTLSRIGRYIQPGTFLFFNPGQGGVDYIARNALGSKLLDVAVCTIQPMPFNCRVVEYGRAVRCQQFEKDFTVCAAPATSVPAGLHLTELMFGGRQGYRAVDGGPILNATLWPLNANIHPQHLYRLATRQHTYRQVPLFYETMDRVSGELMDATSAEVKAVAAAVAAATGVPVSVPTVYEAEYQLFPNPDCTTVDQLFRSSPAYKGFEAPFKRTDGGGVELDFTHRYFTEDVPCGLCVWRGIAELVKVPTPTIDKLILWAQEAMGKQYLVAESPAGLTMTGTDVSETTAPQRFGITTIDELVAG